MLLSEVTRTLRLNDAWYINNFQSVYNLQIAIQVL